MTKWLRRLQSDPKVLTVEEEEEAHKAIESLKGSALSTLGISQEEKIMVVKAMGFTKGHWFKCPNGRRF